jgi:hypothetical protein
MKASKVTPVNKCQLPLQHIVRLAAVSTLFGHCRHHNVRLAAVSTYTPLGV